MIVRGKIVEIEPSRTYGYRAKVIWDSPDFGPCELSCCDSTPDRAREKLKRWSDLIDVHGHDMGMADLTLEEMREMEEKGEEFTREWLDRYHNRVEESMKLGVSN